MADIPSLHPSRIRTFAFTLEGSSLRGLQALYETGFYGNVLSTSAEHLISHWCIDHFKDPSLRANGFSLHDAQQLGYVPCSPGRTRHTPLVGEQWGLLRIRLCGVPRYYIEQLPRREPAKIKNSYYQYPPHRIIQTILEERLPLELKEARQHGILNEDDLPLF